MARKNRNARGRRQTTPYDPLAPWTMPQIQSQAQSMARDAIAPVLADLTRQQNDTAANITGFTGAMNRALAPIAGQVTDAFQTAGNASAGFGSGFADGLKMLAANAPTANGQAGGDIATALAGLLQSGAQNTSRGLGMQGAAEASFAAQYPTFATGRGSQQLEKAIQGYNQERETVQGKVPQIVTDLIQQMLDREIQKGAYRANVEALELDKKRLGLDRDRFDEERRQFDANYSLQQQGITLDWAQLNAQQDEWLASRRERAIERAQEYEANGQEKKAKLSFEREKTFDVTMDSVFETIAAINGGETETTRPDPSGAGKWVDKLDENGQRIPKLDANGEVVEDADLNAVYEREFQPKMITVKTPAAPKDQAGMFRLLVKMFSPALKQRYKFNQRTINLGILDMMRKYPEYADIDSPAPNPGA